MRRGLVMNAVSRARSIVGGHRLPGGPVAKSLEMHRVGGSVMGLVG